MAMSKKNLLALALMVVLVFSTSSSKVTIQSVSASVENSWTERAQMPTARGSLSTAVVNGKIYAIGGANNNGTLGTNEEYDPATNTWTERAPMPTPRVDFGIAIYENKIYAIGGNINGSPTSDTGANEVYDPATDTWATKTPMTTARDALQANVVASKIYLISGLLPTNSVGPIVSDATEIYDPATDSWSLGAPILTPVFAYASAVAENKIYIMGGQTSNGSGGLNQIYDPATNNWTYGQPLPVPVTYAGAGATTGEYAPERIYLIGGVVGGDITGVNQVYNPSVDNWTMGAEMATKRTSLALAVVDDVLYVLGGIPIISLQTPLYALNEQYTPIGYGTMPTPTPSPTPSPSPSPTLQPQASSSPIPTSKPRTGFLGTSLPTEYGYAIVIVVAVVVIAAIALVLRRRLLKQA